MKNKKKILKRSLITMGVLILLLVLDILFWLGPTVKFLAERIGPKALGTPVHIESLSINPRRGTIQLTGFSIENQKSFGTSNAVAVAHLDLALDMGSLFSDTVTVHRIQIDGPHLVFEQNQASDNIAEFIQNLLDFIGYDPEAPPKEKKKKEVDPEKKPKIAVLESLEINDAQFHLTHTDDPMMDIGVRIEQLSASMTNGIVGLKRLHVTNPNRLSTMTLFTLEGIDALIDPATFYTPPFTILDLQVRKPYAFVEWATDASTISEFLNIIDSTLSHIAAWPIPERTEPAEPIEPSPEPSPPPELRKAAVSDIRFHLVNSADRKLSIRAGIDKVETDLVEGSLRLDHFYITNPRRLATPDLFSLEGIDVQFDPATLYAPPFSIIDVQIRQPYVFLENNPETDTIAELIKIAETITESLPTNTAPPTASAQSTDPVDDIDAAPPVALHRFAVDDIQIKLLDSTPTNTSPTKPTMIAGIGAVTIELTNGKLRIEDMTIPNPSGFHAANLYHLALLRIDVEPESMYSNQMVINEIFIDSPLVNLEQTEETGNVAELQKSLMAFVPPTPETAETKPAEPPEPASTNAPVPLAEQPVVLETLLVTNLHISAILIPPIDTNAAPTKTEGIALSSLRPMKNIGEKNTNTTETATHEAIRLLSYDLLKIQPLKGTIEIINLQIGNPHGFANEHLVKLDRFGLCLNPDSLMTDTLVITNIHIHEPRVAYERKITTDNIKTFQETIEGAFARREVVMEKAEDEYDVETDVKQKVIIEHLIVEGGIVKAKISALPTASIPLPDIEMKDIGKDEGGATLGEASSKIFTAFYDSIIGVVANTTGIATDALKGAGSFTLDALGNLTDGFGNLVGSSDDEKEGEPENREPKKKKSRLFRRRVFPR